MILRVLTYYLNFAALSVSLLGYNVICAVEPDYSSGRNLEQTVVSNESPTTSVVELQTQRDGSFYLEAGIGTPLQRFLLQVSTNADTLQVPCKECPCGGHHRNYYDDRSSSFKALTRWWSSTYRECPLTWLSNECNTCSHMEEMVCIGTNCDLGQALTQQVSCCQSYAPHFKEQHADGVLGLSRKDSALVRNFYSHKRLERPVYSLCLGRERGKLILGSESHPNNNSFVPESNAGFKVSASRSDDNYKLSISSLFIDGLQIYSSKIATALVDSASPITYIPAAMHNLVREAFDQFCKRGNSTSKCTGIRDPPSMSEEDEVESPACFEASEKIPETEIDQWLLESFPVLGIRFKDNQEPLCIPPTSYFVRRTKRMFCIALYATKSSEIILGISVLRGFRVTFDTSAPTVTWTKSDCIEEDIFPLKFDQALCGQNLLKRSQNADSESYPLYHTNSPTTFTMDDEGDDEVDYDEGDDTPGQPTDSEDGSSAKGIFMYVFAGISMLAVGSGMVFLAWKRYKKQPSVKSLHGNTYVNMTEMRPIQSSSPSV